ncbi:hypothetical protein AQUCO_01900198v1 [Aquilegia coerulea]|uniref:Carbonic anhydrase n=1 Tax=Aquilegia coerulea TaxID=218851 RepID=A0A2G5DJD6_AQUCA|nr:hypothetical protein AQUCO_01900198v1 [Aquilegia coerulea]
MLGNLHIFAFILLLVILKSRLITSQEVENESEFDYLVGSEKGPHKWGEIHKEWDACKNGEMQSPIDLLNKRVDVLKKYGKLKRNYTASNATLKNRGHDIMLQWKGDAGSLKINGTEYMLKQCHWHSPSEHTINGKRYDLEMHLVHVNPNNTIAVVGVMFDIGQPDPFLTELEKQIRAIGDSHGEVEVGVVDPRHIKLGGKQYYRYMGSLTVPPCTEGVVWIMNKRVRTISKEQVQLLRTAVHDYAEQNARPLQSLNNRPIHLVDPTILQG